LIPFSRNFLKLRELKEVTHAEGVSFLQVLALSLAPVIALFTYFYVRDKYEKEPKALLFKVFVWGALSVFPAIVVGLALHRPLALLAEPGSALYSFVENFIVIALVEEVVKFYVLMRVAYRHPAFNEPYDGMMYAITASLGFAALENVLYVARGGVTVAIARMVLAVPAHALFGAFMGYYAGRAKFAPERESYFLVNALLIPTLLHGTYDILLSTRSAEFALMVIPLSLFMWWRALKQVRISHSRSPFRPDPEPEK